MKVLFYTTEDGRRPFIEWIESLRDQRARHKIEARINRLREGSAGDWKSVGKGVFELRVDYGPGYRVYFGGDDRRIVILLCGGIKSLQQRDIKCAQRFWIKFNREKKYHAI